MFVTFYNKSNINVIQLLNGIYTDFNPLWYKNIGGTLSLTIFINTITPHISKLLIPFAHELYRQYDRGCCVKNLRKGSSDEVNTKQLIQPYLNEIYTSFEMPADYIIA